MRVTRKSRLRLRLENIAFVVLFLTAAGLLAWLSTRYHLQADWTAGGRNTLSVASQELLKRLDGAIESTAYARKDPVLRASISDLFKRYRRHKPDMELHFVNPDTVPDRVRELGIAVDGEVIIEYRGRSEHLLTLSEQAMTNALQRVARAEERWLVFLTGHGERAPLGQANHDLGNWGKQLQSRGFVIKDLNLAEQGYLPEQTTVLVIAAPQVNLLPGEVAIVQRHLKQGGNLLWLADPGPMRGLVPVAEALGLEFQPGVIVDPTTQLFGIESPDVALVTGYPLHPITRDFDLFTVFPQAASLQADPPEPWESQAFLTTSGHAWSETDELAGEIRFDEQTDILGPLDIGIAVSRSLGEDEATDDTNGGLEKGTQRVVVIGNGDFLSNTFLGNAGNLELGMNIVNWLASDDALIAIPVHVARDLNLTLSKVHMATIGLGFLAGLPLLLLGTGVFIWLRRRKR